MKTSELQGTALDWAVAHCENLKLGTEHYVVGEPSEDGTYYKPSTDWAQGGWIIEREGLAIFKGAVLITGGVPEWAACQSGENSWIDTSTYDEITGLTPLIAAMRCYVASKLGDEVEIPEELL